MEQKEERLRIEEIFGIKHKPIFHKKVYKKDDVSQLNKLLSAAFKKKQAKKTSWSASKKSERHFSSSKYDFASGRKQYCAVKARYGTKSGAHHDFYRAYMVQKNRDEVEKKPVLWGTPVDEYEAHFCRQHMKFMISPDNALVEIKPLVNTFMERLEKATGYNFYWMAAEHVNTEHKHAHILINGIDKSGKKVFFPRNMIQRTLREMAQDLCTEMIGERSVEEIYAAQEKLPEAMRFTKLDEQIQKIARPASGEKLKVSVPIERNDLQKRLSFLSGPTMNLAAKDSNEEYSLDANWIQVLRAVGKYNNFIAERNKANGELELYSGGALSGQVQKVYSMNDEDVWKNAIVIRTKDQRNVYVPLDSLPKTKLTGEMITIAAESSPTRARVSLDKNRYKNNSSEY